MMSVLLGIVGILASAVLMIVFMDWAVIALSSFVGADIIIDALNPALVIGLILFTILLTAGVFFQPCLKNI